MDNFIQADIYTASQAIDGITGALTDYGITGFIISDSADFESFLADKNANWDYVDDELMGLSKVEPHITLYVHDNAQGAETLAAIRSLIESWKQNNSDGYYGNLRMELANVKEEDWANSWKQYYKPIHIGNEIVVVPEWEHYEPSAGEKVITMDPGMAFGTGTHETTRLVMRLLEKLMPRDAEGIRNGVLDVGTGSGILSICAAKLNPAACCEAYDIDPMAVRVANENIRKNGLEGRILCREADLLRGVPEHPRRIICANLVADIIIRMIPSLPPYTDPSTVLLASGIIVERRGDVEDCFRSHGYEVFASEQENGWCALAVRKS